MEQNIYAECRSQLLFILRAVRIEEATERSATLRQENLAQIRSGSLVTRPLQQKLKEPDSTLSKSLSLKKDE